MTIDSLKAIAMTYDHILAISASFILHHAHFATESSTDGVADIHFDVDTLVLTSPACTEVGCHHAVVGRHAESTEINLECIGEGCRTMGINIVPILIEIGGRSFCLLIKNELVECYRIDSLHLSVYWGLAREQVLSHHWKGRHRRQCQYC